jgi:MFS family permease
MFLKITIMSRQVKVCWACWTACILLTLSVQFWTSALLAIFGGIILIGSPVLGIVADHTKSRKPPLYFGFTSLLVAVILLAVGDNVKWMIVSRVLQGLSAAGMLDPPLFIFGR